jgi:hypothetical protein
MSRINVEIVTLLYGLHRSRQAAEKMRSCTGISDIMNRILHQDTRHEIDDTQDSGAG